MQYHWRLLTNAWVLQLIALIRSPNHFLGSSLKHDPSWSPEIILCQSQEKKAEAQAEATTSQILAEKEIGLIQILGGIEERRAALTWL